MIFQNEQGGLMVFRAGGIYCLPNGRELVVIRNDEQGLVLCGSAGCNGFEIDEFSINEAGRLVHHGKLTAWDISNLSDTGRTDMNVPYPLKNHVPQSEINP